MENVADKSREKRRHVRIKKSAYIELLLGAQVLYTLKGLSAFPKVLCSVWVSPYLPMLI